MVTPTIQQIKDYAHLKGMRYVDAESFWNFYESKGWYVGKNKMKKWRAAVSGWNARERRKAPQNTKIERSKCKCGQSSTHSVFVYFPDGARTVYRCDDCPDPEPDWRKRK